MRITKLSSACASFGLILALAAIAAWPGRSASKRPTISDGERAAASWAVQNLVSRHDYLHGAALNMEEIQSDWVSPTGPFAATAVFSSPDWALYGMHAIVNSYGRVTRQGSEAALRKLSEIDPNVKDSPENFGAGSSLFLHTNTTPIIEIAGDGKTAQGLWYTPGVDINPIIQNGKIYLRGTFSYQKLGADFVKENGVWKIWHLLIAFDISPPLSQEMLASTTGKLGDLVSHEPLKSAGAPPPAPDRAGGIPDMKKPPYSYPRWSPERPGKVFPNLPKPYYTFSETFSNCNCRQQLPSVLTSDGG